MSFFSVRLVVSEHELVPVLNEFQAEPENDQQKYDYDSMKRFRGTSDISNGFKVMRNLNAETMRGYIDDDGFGFLRDQGGNFYRVNTR